MSKQKSIIETINENIIYNEMIIKNFKRNNKYKYVKKKRDETAMLLKEYKSRKEEKLTKDDKKKLINDNNNNYSPKTSIQTFISIMKIISNDKKIQSINAQNIKKRKDLKIDRLKEIHEQKRKNDIIEKILFSQDINGKSYITELKNNQNYGLNWLFIFIFYIINNIYFLNEGLLRQRLILQNITLFNKWIVLFFIVGIITSLTKRKFEIILSTAMTYIKIAYNQIIYSMKNVLFCNRIKVLFKILDLNSRKRLKNGNNKLGGKRKKRKKNIIKNYITNNNYIIIVIIKSFLIINLFCRIKSNIYDSYFFHDLKITLKVKGNSENAIFNNDFEKLGYLKEVYINGKKENNITYKYNFNKEDNFVELVWNERINDTKNMFSGCTSITEINLSNFDTSQVTSMDNMFEGCTSLTSIDLTNFKTSSVKRMTFMFSSCSSLTSLNLSHFDTSSVTTMDSMFSHCSSLSSINLSNFDVSSLVSMDSIFFNCVNLEYINLYNFNESKIKPNMLENVPNNLVICINGTLNNLFYNAYNKVYNCTYNNIYNYIYNYTSYNKSYFDIINKNCFIIDCSKDWKSKQKKIINSNNECIESCSGNKQYKYEYNGKCYKKCPNGVLNGNKCKCELDNCLSCPQVALNKGLCTECNTNYYPIENDSFNLGEYINCYKQPEGYYLDTNLYKKCYETCKTCTTQGNSENHNCLTCNENFRYGIQKNNYVNCNSNCSYYYYHKENNYYCTMNLSCPDEYPKLKENSNECTNSLTVDDVIEVISNIDKDGIEESKLQQIKYYDNILQSIESSFTSENYDTSNIDNGKEDVIKTEKMTVTFTTSQNQKNNIKKNSTSIDLGECETLLRNFYGIPSNETLYIKKIDIAQDGTKAVKVEYDVYCKLSGTNLVKLNLTICGGSKVSILVPIAIHDNVDKLNTSSGYYNDICYTTTSEDGTDISLADRKNDYANNDNIICQEGCIFSEYDKDSHFAKCSCDVKESPPSIADMNINKEKLLENFKDIKNIINFDFLKCYKTLFTKEGIMNNYGCYLILIIIVFHILCIFIFRISHFRLIQKKIIHIASIINKEQSEQVKGVKETKKKSKFNDKEIFIYRAKNKKKQEKIKLDNKKFIKNSNIKINTNKKPTVKNIGAKDKTAKNSIPLNSSSKNSIMGNIIIKNNSIKINIKKNKPLKKKEIKNNPTKKRSIKNIAMKNNINPKSIMSEKTKIIKKENFNNYIDEEINGLSYKIALKYDKRTYCQYYGSLIKTQHNLICVLFNNSDYNSGIIKMDLFLVGFVIEYTVNALFYNDDTMHEIYESKGQFDLETQLPIIVYSTLISYILNLPLNSLALSNDSVIDFKQSRLKNDIMKKAKKLINMLNIKFNLYFIISSLFLLFFWYYISIFGAIYKNTQFHLLKDILMSFGLSMLFPFAIYFLPGLLRIPALSSKKEDKKCLYNFSKFIQSF